MSPVFDELDREWRRLCTDPVVCERLTDVCEVAAVDGPSELERFAHTGPRPDADRLLVALARRSSIGDGLAARVLLQLLLPGVRRLARTWWALGDDDERAAAVLSAVWDHIQRYPIDRRPARVAANILMDAAADIRRSLRGHDRVQAVADPPFADSPGASPRDAASELVGVLADGIEAGVITRADAELVAASRIAGTPLREIAGRRNVPLRTLQHRRKRAEQALVASGPVLA